MSSRIVCSGHLVRHPVGGLEKFQGVIEARTQRKVVVALMSRGEKVSETETRWKETSK
jgi:hypothetical protein